MYDEDIPSIEPNKSTGKSRDQDKQKSIFFHFVPVEHFCVYRYRLHFSAFFESDQEISSGIVVIIT